MGLFGNAKTPLVGLDISSTAVKLLQLTENGGRYRVGNGAAGNVGRSSTVVSVC